MLLEVHPIDWNTIITATVGAVILGALTLGWNVLKKLFTKHSNRTTLLEFKIDSTIHGLGAVNHGFGEQFQSAYEKKFKELKETHDFIEDDD